MLILSPLVWLLRNVIQYLPTIFLACRLSTTDKSAIFDFSNSSGYLDLPLQHAVLVKYKTFLKKTRVSSPVVSTAFCRRRSGHVWSASSPLHDTRTMNLALVQCVRPANNLSLQELHQLIGILLLTFGFLEIFGS